MILPPQPLPSARELFSIDPSVAHLNHGSYGTVPLPVQAVQREFRERMEANPMRFFAREIHGLVADARHAIAGFLGADPALTALVPNATTAAQIVAESVPLTNDDQVIVTDHAYGTVVWGLTRACARSGAEVVTVPIDLDATDDEIVAALQSAVTPRTRLLMVDHITSPTAKVMPVERIVAAMGEAGVPVMVDAAHAPGMLPVDVTALGADFWLGNLHKWAYAPRGTAALVIKPRWRDQIRPVVVSWEDNAGFPGSVEWQATADYTGWLAAPAGIAVLNQLGADQVRAHNAALAAYGQRIIAEALNLPAGPPASTPIAMRLLPLPAGMFTSAGDLTRFRDKVAEEAKLELAMNYWRDQAFVRISAQVYNHPGEYARCAETLNKQLTAL
ncbi:aminotransferase class V-fold PLP-dependent enzyme [Longispora albida]|uniref:aminotransferase class V-fold PLP-dependent enzyme n=1 Tax=Longispora albida TaxID=203523 RepID=UPI00036C3035|nr:aminotransferase class V-fold PLP-dependent enzyme [Longispora albida]